jgi:uncharacterized protein (TIGR02145 family)
MKKIYTLIASALLSASLWAQAPQSFSYQAVVRGANNELVVNKQVSVKISILQTSENGTPVYIETHTPTANANGLVSVAIGAGTSLNGTFTTIDWAKGPFFIKTEVDPIGTANYSLISTSQLLSVPFALYAANSQPGPKGEKGDQGIPGKDGVDGKNGQDGKEGPQGPIGPKGDTGAIGPQGPIGLTGPAGNDGMDGKNGLDGKEGPQGPIGPKGDTGAIGPQGLIGLNGPAGKDGVDGKNGTDGKEGAQGPIGPKGDTGAIGPQGLSGKDGIDGKNGADGKEGPKGIPGSSKDEQKLSVSAIGDTLYLTNGNFVIIPGLSAANTKTNPTSGYGQNISDVEGNSYKTVYIGTQQWMAENLKVSRYNDGTSIPYVMHHVHWQNGAEAWVYYNNDSTNNDKFGKLYNWYAVSSTTNGNKNVCPTGWHVPTDNEWRVLTDYMGGESVAGGKLKEVDTSIWNSPNTDATNSSLFSALPGGNRDYNGTFNAIGISGGWWSTSEYTESHIGWSLGLINNNGNASTSIANKLFGLSVRCLKD